MRLASSSASLFSSSSKESDCSAFSVAMRSSSAAMRSRSAISAFSISMALCAAASRSSRVRVVSSATMLSSLILARSLARCTVRARWASVRACVARSSSIALLTASCSDPGNSSRVSLYCLTAACGPLLNRSTMNPPTAWKRAVSCSTTAPSPAIMVCSCRAPRRVLVNAPTKAVTPTTKAPIPVAMMAARVSLRPVMKVFVPAAAFLNPVTAPPVAVSSAPEMLAPSSRALFSSSVKSASWLAAAPSPFTFMLMS